MKTLVTGGTGVVGANLIRALLAAGRDVRALVRRGPAPRALLGLPIESVEGDVLDPASLARAAAGVDVVFHAAARFTYRGVGANELDRVAVDGTRHMIEAAANAGVRRVVLTSSSVIFGSSPRPAARDESATLTREDASTYAMSKVRQTTAAFATAREIGIETVAVCPALTIGGWDYRLAESNAALVKYLNDPFRTTFTGGCNIVSAADVARGHILVAERGTPGQMYLVGGENADWREVHAEISTLCGTYGPLATASHVGAYLAAAWGEVMARGTGIPASLTRDEVRMMGRWYWYDDGRARALGYQPSSMRDALREALIWLLRTEHIRADVRAAIQMAGRFAEAVTGEAVSSPSTGPTTSEAPFEARASGSASSGSTRSGSTSPGSSRRTQPVPPLDPA